MCDSLHILFDYDITGRDIPTLIIMRQSDYIKYDMIRIIQGNDAVALYNYLTSKEEDINELQQ